MVSIPKIIGVMSCSVVLGLSLSNTAQAAEEALAADRMKTDPCTEQTIGQSQPENCDRRVGEGADNIKGELVRISGDTYVVQQFTGQEVRLHTDANTQMTKGLRQGDRIEATRDNVRDLNDHKRVLSIRQIN